MAFLRFWKRRSTEQPPPPKRANPDRIAVLESELLGVTPEPGTPAARAVALARPVDQDRCPHDDIIDITELAQARPTGLCQRCGAGMVATDEGDWERP